MAYDSNRMQMSRRLVVLGLTTAGACLSRIQDQPSAQDPLPPLPRRDHDHDNDEKMPNGKSRADAIADEEHKKALNEAEQLLQMAQKLKDELKEAGRFVVPVAAVRRTEDIEKLARKIRARLKA